MVAWECSVQKSPVFVGSFAVKWVALWSCILGGLLLGLRWLLCCPNQKSHYWPMHSVVCCVCRMCEFSLCIPLSLSIYILWPISVLVSSFLSSLEVGLWWRVLVGGVGCRTRWQSLPVVEFVAVLCLRPRHLLSWPHCLHGYFTPALPPLQCTSHLNATDLFSNKMPFMTENTYNSLHTCKTVLFEHFLLLIN